jgi:hypothetical protein
MRRSTVSACARDIVEKPTITGHDKPWERNLPGIETLMPTAFHAHCLLLYFVRLLFCRDASNLLSDWLPRLWEILLGEYFRASR